jgi:hypothetical protein
MILPVAELSEENKMSIPKHDNWAYRNQTVHWNGSDQSAKFKNNFSNPETRKILQDLGLDSPECISYQFNSYGFRDQEFDSRDCALAFGCSFTQGIGIGELDTWPRLLSSILGIHVWNLGIGGCALDTIFRISEYYIKHLKPKYVLLLEPAPWRIEYAVNSDEFEVILPNTLQLLGAGEFIKNWFAHEINSNLNSKKNILGLKYLCSQMAIPLYVLKTQEHGNDCMARDLLHPGKKYHQNMSEMFYSIITMRK